MVWQLIIGMFREGDSRDYLGSVQIFRPTDFITFYRREYLGSVQILLLFGFHRREFKVTILTKAFYRLDLLVRLLLFVRTALSGTKVQVVPA